MWFALSSSNEVWILWKSPSISEYSREFVEFITKDKRVYTKINGAIRNEYTFDATKDKGLDAQNAIIQYAKQTNSFHYQPLSKTEEKMFQLQNQLSEVKATLFKEMHRKIKIYY